MDLDEGGQVVDQRSTRAEAASLVRRCLRK